MRDKTETHALLFAEQERQPRHLTIREMGAILDIESTSHVRYILDGLVAEGMAERIGRGKGNIYRMKLPSWHG